MEIHINDVAEAAHVSISTVSRAFTKPSTVVPSTRTRVLRIAKELNFYVSRSAAILKSGHSMRIAVLTTSDLRLWFSASVMEGLNEILHPQGYDLLIFQLSSDAARRDFFSTLPVRRNTDAIIVISFDISKDEAARILHIGLPIVGINCDSPKQTGFTAAVNIDDVQGSAVAARHLLNLGHRKVVYVRTSHDVSLSSEAKHRYEAFMKCCSAGGISPSTITIEERENDISQLVARMSALADFPTAVACQEDDIAVPLLFRLIESGYHVPTELSLIGYDDSLYAQDIGLTTIRQRPLELAHLAAKMTLELIRGKEIPENPFKLVPAELVLRYTTARAIS